jgi:hypothetical protein
MEDKTLTLEQKVDLLLNYQRKAERRAKIHTIVSWTLIFIFFILPMIGTYYFFKNLVSGMEPGQLDTVMNSIQSVKNLNTATSISDFQNLMNK